MNRRSFLHTTAIATLSANTVILSTSQATAMGLGSILNLRQGTLDPALIVPMKNLLSWMREHGWGDVITSITGIDFKTLSPESLANGDELPFIQNYIGCDDFVGVKLITPGKPQESLLYHVLASPRVRLANGEMANNYPDLEQLDFLENFIYSLQKIETKDINQETMVIAVFAYEYRPACKTPHEYHADMVFSRTGFARIGTKPFAGYDRINRCFTNRPNNQSDEKEIAVTPARYALFLAERLPYKKISNNLNEVSDNEREFLLPIRKLYFNDPVIHGYELSFEESHITERLARIFKSGGVVKPEAVTFRDEETPFKRVSNSSFNKKGLVKAEGYDDKLVDLKVLGSSVLLSPYPAPLVKPAFQIVNNRMERLRVNVPEFNGKEVQANRRYSTFKLTPSNDLRTDAIQLVLNETIRKRKTTDYRSPRNEPMFVNMREPVDEKTGDIIKLDGTYDTNDSHWIGLFEDNICDGCVTASLTKTTNISEDSVAAALANLHVLPAFSVVTAPDFFPLAESYDLEEYKDMFLNGGTRDMSIGRLAANPKVCQPFKETSAFPSDPDNETENAVRKTMLAVISQSGDKVRGKNIGTKKRREEAETQTRGNFLPDSATLFFYPGWDLTYSADYKDVKYKQRLYYSTMGLGSPFVEDSKLCAAANGMWAATSPDSSRTFWATIDPIQFKGIAPTTMPLLDCELGYHENSTPALALNSAGTYGWDGEQGPFLYKNADHFLVNGTDIKLSNYVANAMKGMFDMSQLRIITVREMRNRVACLQKCYQKMNVKRNQVWLVGAEILADDHKIASLPPSLVGTDLVSQVIRTFTNRPDYAFLLTRPRSNKNMYKVVTGTKRITHEVGSIYLCLVNKEEIKMACFLEANNWVPKWIS